MATCKNCNGELTFNPKTQTMDCPYCASSFAMDGTPVAATTSFSQNPKLIIPFTVAVKDFNKEALSYLVLGPDTPMDIAESYKSNTARGIYIPLYKWDIKYSIAGPNGPKDKTRTVYKLGAGYGEKSTSLTDFAAKNVSSKNSAKPFDDKYASGFEILTDDILIPGQESQLQESGMSFAKTSVMDQAMNSDDEINDIPNEENTTIDALALTVVYVPFWENIFDYENSPFWVIMSGTSRTDIDSHHPVESLPEIKDPPSYAIAAVSAIAGLICFLVGFVTVGHLDKFVTLYILCAGFFLVVIVTPILYLILRNMRLKWESPGDKLFKIKQEKLASLHLG